MTCCEYKRRRQRDSPSSCAHQGTGCAPGSAHLWNWKKGLDVCLSRNPTAQHPFTPQPLPSTQNICYSFLSSLHQLQLESCPGVSPLVLPESLISSHLTQSCHEEVRDNRVGKVLLLWETHPGACTGVLEIMCEFLRWNQHTDSGLCQSEGASLTTGLCESKGILCVPIGTAVACIIN